MLIRIVEGPGSPWAGSALIDDAGIVIEGRGYWPFDDLRGIVIVEATAEEEPLLAEMGFSLARLQ